MQNAQNVLVVGGSSGLGLQIARRFSEVGATVCVTGRSSQFVPQDFKFVEFDITADLGTLERNVEKILVPFESTDLLVYAAGFWENGHIAELSDDHIRQMIHVGLTAPALILQRMLKKQPSLSGFIAVTSTSQWTPREKEPLYAATKAGLAMLAQSVSFDPSVKKTLVVGPSGMKTNFWIESGRETSLLLSPEWVASQILELWADRYKYRLARILREPERVQVLETREN